MCFALVRVLLPCRVCLSRCAVLPFSTACAAVSVCVLSSSLLLPPSLRSLCASLCCVGSLTIAAAADPADTAVRRDRQPRRAAADGVEPQAVDCPGRLRPPPLLYNELARRRSGRPG